MGGMGGMADEIVGVPVLQQVQVHMIINVQNPVEVPQIEYDNHLMCVPVQMFVHAPQGELVDKFVEVPIREQLQVITKMRGLSSSLNFEAVRCGKMVVELPQFACVGNHIHIVVQEHRQEP
eukprot:4868027-Alexandrium_andersonii.AAC.1